MNNYYISRDYTDKTRYQVDCMIQSHRTVYEISSQNRTGQIVLIKRTSLSILFIAKNFLKAPTYSGNVEDFAYVSQFLDEDFTIKYADIAELANVQPLKIQLTSYSYK